MGSTPQRKAGDFIRTVRVKAGLLRANVPRDHSSAGLPIESGSNIRSDEKTKSNDARMNSAGGAVRTFIAGTVQRKDLAYEGNLW
mmetsp:Transcript_15272/g.44344  ORF Transcript_15272/g.44344 Transcript_15272/m.44344 type:complete len:85 (+) Transcript_15272:1589-1843(+)